MPSSPKRRTALQIPLTYSCLERIYFSNIFKAKRKKPRTHQEGVRGFELS